MAVPEKLSATAKLRKQLAEFLDVEESGGESDDSDHMETIMEEEVEGSRGQFRRGSVVYDLNDASAGEEETDEPARKKPKKTKSASKKIDKDLEVHMKIKSTLQALNKSSRTAASTNQQQEDQEDEDQSGEESEDSGDEVELKWKDNLAQKASEAFYERQTGKGNLRKLVYGSGEADEELASDASDQEDEDGQFGGLFRLASYKNSHRQSTQSSKDQVDCSRFLVDKMQDWSKSSVLDSIRDCFVTGKWEENRDAEELLALDELEEDSEGDFEDLETGQKQSKPEDEEEEESRKGRSIKETPEDTKKRLLERKRKLKERFNSEYDNGGEGKSKTYYDDLKEEMDQQAQLNRSEFESMDDDTRVQYEGFRPGMYVRMEIEDVPCELVTNFNPIYPLIVGALLAGEENIGFVQVLFLKYYSKFWKQLTFVFVFAGSSEETQMAPSHLKDTRSAYYITGLASIPDSTTLLGSRSQRPPQAAQVHTGTHALYSFLLGSSYTARNWSIGRSVNISSDGILLASFRVSNDI